MTGFGHLPVAKSKGEPGFAGFWSLTVRADFHADWRTCMKTKTPGFLAMVVPEKKEGARFFFFTVRKPKPFKIQFRVFRFGTAMAGKTAKKNTQSNNTLHCNLGLSSVDLAPSGFWHCRLFPVSACASRETFCRRRGHRRVAVLRPIRELVGCQAAIDKMTNRRRRGRSVSASKSASSAASRHGAAATRAAKT